MDKNKRNDVIYGQNWIQQGLDFRHRHCFRPFTESCFIYPANVMNAMGQARYHDNTGLWQRRRERFVRYPELYELVY